MANRHVVEGGEPRRTYQAIDTFLDKDTLKIFEKYDIVECSPGYAKKFHELIPCPSKQGEEYDADEWSSVRLLFWHHFDHREKDKENSLILRKENEALKAEIAMMKGFDVYEEFERLPEETKRMVITGYVPELEAELATAHQRIAALTAAQPAPEETPTSLKTTAATEARATTELALWKSKYAPAMVKVALRCGAEGKKKRQSGDFIKLFKDAGVTLSKNMLVLFRGWLSDEYTDRKGGAPTQD